MKPYFFSRVSLTLAFAAGLTAAVADSIKLKNGTVYNGTIVDETADSYGMDVKEGKGIVDYKKIPKADVAEVKRDMPDEREAEELKAKLKDSPLKDTPDGLTAQDYDKRVKTQIQPWLDKYKTSKKRGEIEALLKLHLEEGARVKAGDVKLRGTWITAAEAKWNEYNISARKLRGKMDTALKEKKELDAFMTFAELEAGYVASIDYPPSVDAIRKALPLVEQALTRAAEAQPALAEERKKETAGLEPAKKKEKEAVFAKEKADYLAKVATIRKNKLPVVAFNPYDLKTIQDALAVVKKEGARLGALDVAALTATAKKFEAGLKDLNEKAYLSAKTNLDAVSKIHTKDVVVKTKLAEATKGLADSKAKPPGTK